MSELKTLKDMKKYVFSKGEVVGVEYLRAEAVKWVKEILKHKDESKFTIKGRTHFANEWFAVADFIVWNNNLTEEDLR